MGLLINCLENISSNLRLRVLEDKMIHYVSGEQFTPSVSEIAENYGYSFVQESEGLALVMPSGGKIVLLGNSMKEDRCEALFHILNDITGYWFSKETMVLSVETVLVPKDRLRHVVYRLDSTIISLSDLFAVPEIVIERRLKALGII